MSYLRPSNIDVAKHAWAILKLLVTRLRQEWPGVKIIFRGDCWAPPRPPCGLPAAGYLAPLGSGFCRWKMLRWGERHGVDYIVGLAKNSRLLALAGERMQRRHGAMGELPGKAAALRLARLTPRTRGIAHGA